MIRNWRVSALLIATVVVVTACGGGGASASAPAASAPGASAPAASAPAASAAAGGSITVTSLWGGSEQESFQKVLDAFKAKTGITATYESIRTDYATVLQTRITGGNPPDVVDPPGHRLPPPLRQGRLDQEGRRPRARSRGARGQLRPRHPRRRHGRWRAVRDHGQVQQQEHALVSARPVHGGRRRPRPTTWDEFKAALETLKDKSPGRWRSAPTDDLDPDRLVREHLPPPGRRRRSTTSCSAATLPLDRPVGRRQAVDTMNEVLNDDYVAGGIDGRLGRAWTDGIAQVFGPTAEAAVYYEGGFVGGIATGQVNTALVSARRSTGRTSRPSAARTNAGHHRWRRHRGAHRQAGRQGVHRVHDHRRGGRGLGGHRRDHLAAQGRRARTSTRTTSSSARPLRWPAPASSASTAPTSCPPAARDLGAELQKAISGDDRRLGRLRVAGQDRLGQRVTAADLSLDAGGPPGLPRPFVRAHEEDEPMASTRRQPIRSSPPATPRRKAPPDGRRRNNWRGAASSSARPRSCSSSSSSIPTIYTIAAQLQPRPPRRVHRVGRARQLRRPCSPTTRTSSTWHVPAVRRGLEQRPVDHLLHELRARPRAPRRDPRGAGPLRVDHQGDRLPADGHRGDGAGRHLEVRLRAGREHRAAERDPRHRQRRADLVAGQPERSSTGRSSPSGSGARSASRRSSCRRPSRASRARSSRRLATDGANERQIFFRIILPMVSLPISVLAVTLIVNVVKLFDLIYVMTNGGPGTASRVIGFTIYLGGVPGGPVRQGARGGGDHADPADPDHDLQHPALPNGGRGMTAEHDALAGPAIRPEATTLSGRIVAPPQPDPDPHRARARSR